jgi:hypothetical protein
MKLLSNSLGSRRPQREWSITRKEQLLPDGEQNDKHQRPYGGRN